MMMKVLSVVPILRGVAPELLSYYTSLPVSTGALVEVPIRKRFAPALVVKIEDVEKSASDLRRAAFALKKVKRVISPAALPPPVFETAAYLADYYAAPLGAALYAVLPRSLIQAPNFLHVLEGLPKETARGGQETPVPRVAQLPYDERVSHYKSIIRQSFAAKRSVVVITPTRAHADDLYARLSKGIEDHATLLACGLTPKQTRDRWESAAGSEDPVLVIGTMIAASVWRTDIAHYILEHEASPYYKSAERPFIDARVTLAALARHRGANLTFGDGYLRIETLAKSFSHEYEELFKPQMHQGTGAAVTLIDMRDVPHVQGESPALSPQGEDAMEKAIQDHKRTFIYATRKGHTPLTLCRDCGTVLVCDRCDAPMVLHAAKNDAAADNRRFECHRCGHVRDAKTVCDVCGGWRLYAYGMGVEKIYEALKERKKEVPIFLLSNDTAKTHAEAARITTAWEESERGVLVGTVRSLPYLRQAPPSTTILASFETLLMLPDIYMQERLFSLLSFMREITAHRLVVQTRSPEQETLRQALSGDGLSFYKSEHERRKLFSYPPYGVPVKITLQGKERAVLSHLNALKEMFAPHELSIYPAFVSKVKDNFVAHALFSVPSAQWPDMHIVERLRTLPPTYRIEVNPESLL